MKQSFLVIILVIFGFLLYADDGSATYFPGGGSLYLFENPFIEMLEELVIIDYRRVVTEFYFRNTSTSSYTATLGFPVEYSKDFIFKIDRFMDDFQPPISKEQEDFLVMKSSPFICLVDGKEIQRTLTKDDEGNYYYTTKITFSPQETKRVINVYYCGLRSYDSSIGESGWEQNYSLITGSTWKGTIGKVVIKLKIDKAYTISSTPNWVSNIEEEYNFDYDSYSGTQAYIAPIPTRFEDGYAIWEYKNLKPNFNISWGEIHSAVYIREWMAAPLRLKYLLAAMIHFKITTQEQEMVFINYIDNFIHYDFQEIIKNKEWIQYYKDITIYKQAMTDLFKAIIQYSNSSDKSHTMQPAFLQALCRLYINSQYALNGFMFSTQEWSDYFSSFSWYTPKSKSISFDETTANRIQNIQEIENKSMKEVKQ